MTNLEHISYSQYNTYLQCPRSWYLGKVRFAEEKQTWFLPVGTALHTMIEDFMHGRPVGRPEDYFYPLVEKQMEVEPDDTRWLAGGAKDNPVIRAAALEQLVACYASAVEYLKDFEVFEIEADLSGQLPGLDVPIKAYADVLGWHKDHGKVILDWKTGRSKPKDNFQLETYRALCIELGKEYHVGHFAMLNPAARQAKPVDLLHVDPLEVGAKYQAVYERMIAKHYETRPGFGCRFCFQQENCLLQAGPTRRAKFYDHASEDGYAF